jgi:hypothetical protein
LHLPPPSRSGPIGPAIGAGLGFRLQSTAAAVPSPDDLAGETIRHLGLQVKLPRSPSPPELSMDLSTVILWAITAAAVVVLLYCVAKLYYHRWRDAPEWPGSPPAVGGEQTGHLARAERFAHLGSFVEAMHEVLLECFHEIRAHAGERLADSLTSREILRATGLPEQGRVALRAIVTCVEWTYFGEHAATLADYHACRGNFDALRSALLRTGIR